MRQLQDPELGQYKPLIVMPAEEDSYIVLGGNMRLLAFRELRVETAVVSVVYPKSEAEATEYAMSDNDKVGEYDTGLLFKVILPVKDDISPEDFRITLGKASSLPEVMRDYGPDLKILERVLDETIPTRHKCQECGYKW